MKVASVASIGQITLPKNVRQQKGIRQGSRIESASDADHVEMLVRSAPSEMTESGFGMLKSRRAAVPVDFGVATLQKK